MVWWEDAFQYARSIDWTNIVPSVVGGLHRQSSGAQGVS